MNYADFKCLILILTNHLHAAELLNLSRNSTPFNKIPVVHYRVQKSLPMVPILIQMNPVHTLPTYLRSILISSHLHLDLPSGLSKTGIFFKYQQLLLSKFSVLSDIQQYDRWPSLLWSR